MEKTLHLLTLLIISGWDCEKYCPKTDQHSRITITGLDSPPRTQIRGPSNRDNQSGARGSLGALCCAIKTQLQEPKAPYLGISCLTLSLFWRNE